MVERRLAAEILRGIQGLEPDLDTWKILTEIEIEMRRQKERLDEFSDESASALHDIKRMIDAVERALKFLRDSGLEPDIHTDTVGVTV